ncbi:hypothetical protein [Allorhodopirellula heiligendammensis]|uniref:WW domain-containing protein n=1 Tax=Allorhodopirellula heiligendammensis TaxID=2714739 RepID=A0A5C6C2W2_9BACT|nr:hypothetical protein [Allorhodopirellula heiligendammensis]TWU18458.1 hypothetical protein Poly21_06210 [Allorhodopirellula heiligendammensis]
MNVKRNHGVRSSRRPLMSAVALAGLALTPGVLPAQDIGKAITDSITQRAVPGNVVPSANGTQNTTQSAAQRGLDRALQGTLQGQPTRDAIRSGLGEAAQSAAETPQQTMQRDQNRQPQNQQYLQGQQTLQPTPTGQPWQRDAQGRLFYQNELGERVYRGDGQATQWRPQNSPDSSLEQQFNRLKQQVESLAAEVEDLKTQVRRLKAEQATPAE